MKSIINYFNEALIGKKNTINIYNYIPQDTFELRYILKERLEEDENADLNDIDVSKITDMSGEFNGLDPHNIDISKWNVSNVKDFRNMFQSCKNLNCDISKWKVSNAKDMSMMFCNCQNFNCDLSEWDVSQVEDMSSMFSHCYKFEGIGLDKWKVSNVKHMYWMFEKCKNLNINLSNWKPFKVKDKVKDMEDMFDGCTSLKNIPDWYKE